MFSRLFDLENGKVIKLAEEAFFPWYDHRVSAFADRLRAVCMVLAPVKDNVKHIA